MMLRSRVFLNKCYISLRPYLGIGSVFIVLFLVLSITQEMFLTKENQINILRASSITFILAIGCTFNMLAGGFDLSVGSMVALSGLFLAELLHAGVPEWPAVVMVLLMGGFIGSAINGVLIGKLRVNFFVVTLGTMAIYRSAVYVYTDGETKYIDQWPLVRTFADGTFFGFPVPVILIFCLFIVAYFILKQTAYGRAIYAVGGNREASILSGIPASLVEISVYGISGLLAAFGGVVQAGRLAAASPVVGRGIALEVAAVVLLGGTSFSGGIGGVVGTVIGVFFIGVLKNGLGVVGISGFWQGVVTGVILVMAVVFDKIQSRGLY